MTLNITDLPTLKIVSIDERSFIGAYTNDRWLGERHIACMLIDQCRFVWVGSPRSTQRSARVDSRQTIRTTSAPFAPASTAIASTATGANARSLCLIDHGNGRYDDSCHRMLCGLNAAGQCSATKAGFQPAALSSPGGGITNIATSAAKRSRQRQIQAACLLNRTPGSVSSALRSTFANGRSTSFSMASRCSTLRW